MLKFRLTLIAVNVMALLIPLAPHLATSPTAPLYTHFAYMFGHANLLHWLINGWALLVLHNLFRPFRLLLAYLLSVAISFLPPQVLFPAFFSLHTIFPAFLVGRDIVAAPLLGASVITVFFLGFAFPYLYRRDRLTALMIPAIILVGFFVPGIAAVPHLIMFLLGIIYFYLERLYYFLYNLPH